MQVLVADIIDSIQEEVDQERFTALIDSIKEKGLMHPLGVQSVNGKYNLVVGKKRFIACKQLGITEVEVNVIGDESMSEDSKLVLRIHENLKRSNLAWWEEALMTARLHELWQKEHGAPTGRSGPMKDGWGQRDTSRELNKALGYVSESIALATEISKDPTLKNITDKKTALRLIRQKVKRIEQEESQGLSLVDVEANQILLGPAAAVLRQMPDAFIDATITDPPWIEFREKNLTKDNETWPVFKELYRVMKYDSFLMMFVGVEDFIWYRENLPTLGFQVQGHPNIWYKISGLISYGVRPWEFQRNLELIIVAVKGNPTLVRSTQQSCIYSHPVIAPASLRHPNEKPIKLIEEMINQVTYEGAFILDPFGGSGVTGEAVMKMNRRYLIIEREKEYYDKICERLEK